MVTTTTTYSLKKPTVGDDEDVWGGYLNDSMDLIDDVLDGTTPVTGIDINSGTIDNAVIGGTTPVAGTFTNLTATGTTTLAGASTSADITFGDNDKAIFGAGSDLQIYHTGTTNYLYALADININANTGVNIQAKNGEESIVAEADGAVTLYYDDAAKLATASTGVDITGNIAVSGTVDGRDVAADGTKLDGIESGATADQTKADIDALGIAASTAATLATARNIALSGDVSGSASFNGSANISITATVADDSHNHVISNIDGLQSALDGKQASGTYNTIIGTDSDINTSGSTIIDNIFVTDGVITSMGTRTLTLADLGYTGATNANYITNNNQLTNGAGYTTNVGDITGVTAGTNLTGGGSSGSVTLNVSSSPTFSGVVLAESLQEDYDALSGTSPAPDADNAGAFSLTMTGNTTFTFGSVTSGRSVGFVLQLTGNGSTVTWPSSVDWAGGTAPDAPASGETDILVFWTRDGGTTWYGVQSIDAAA